METNRPARVAGSRKGDGAVRGSGRKPEAKQNDRKGAA